MSSSSSSSTSTELCDDPLSDCCSQKSADDEDCDNRNRVIIGDADNGGGTEDFVDVVIDRCRPEVKPDDDDNDVSLAEMLRANSEVLNRMCKGDGDVSLAHTPETGAARSVDLGERLPDLINDIDVLGESLQASTESSSPHRELCVVQKVSAECPVQEPRQLEDDYAAPLKPFAPFPSKVRQPKRLGIELGLYPDS